MAKSSGNIAQMIESDSKLGQRFRILTVLGEGAAGAVYLVRDAEHDGKEVALKVLRNREAFDEHTLDRFKQELVTLREIDHPNLVKAYDYICARGIVGFTLEYVNGPDLYNLLKSRELDKSEIDSIICQVLSALHELHTRGIVHRDLKLENILIDKEGRVKVSDLGLMKDLSENSLTKTGMLLGTAQYLPPEYIRNSEYTQRGDIYAVGLMMYELLTRERWLKNKPGQKAIDYMMERNFEFPKVALQGMSAKYRNILGVALSADPKDRFENVHEMRDAILNYGQQPTGSIVEVKQSIAFGNTSEGNLRFGTIEKSNSSYRFEILVGLAVVSMIATIGIAALGMLH